MNTCVVENCKWSALENKYCKRHQRKYKYNEIIASGKNVCRFFFRGCNNEIPIGEKTCRDCIDKKYEGKSICDHESCKSHVSEDNKFCKKHHKDKYYIEEKEKGIKYCDIARSCFNILENGKAKCDECRAKARENERKVFESRSDRFNYLVKNVETSERICVDCGNDFEKYLTIHGKESRRCTKFYFFFKK